jgi:hypothetical protein
MKACIHRRNNQGEEEEEVAASAGQSFQKQR